MIYKRAVILVLLFSAISLLTAAAQESKDTAQGDPQQINDFSISGYGDKGRKSWDVSGKSADIFEDKVTLDDVKGNLYGEGDNVKLTADNGIFHRDVGVVHLENNVFVSTDSGATLATDSLDWDRKKQLVTTRDDVNIERDNMIATAVGAIGKPGLNKVTLKKNVRAEITEDPGQELKTKQKVIITCDGPLDIDYARNVAVFKNNVKIDREDSQITSDEMTAYFTRKEGNLQGLSGNGGRLQKIIARGNVKIVRGENITYSDEAVYNALDGRIVLSGRPKLIIYSTEDVNAPLGN